MNLSIHDSLDDQVQLNGIDPVSCRRVNYVAGRNPNAFVV